MLFSFFFPSSLPLQYLLFIFTNADTTACESEERLFHKLFSRYNQFIRPVENVSDPVTVHFELAITQLTNVVRSTTEDRWDLGTIGKHTKCSSSRRTRYVCTYSPHSWCYHVCLCVHSEMFAILSARSLQLLIQAVQTVQIHWLSLSCQIPLLWAAAPGIWSSTGFA